MTETDVIVVGAGWAGITAARELARAGRSVVVLEARDRIGGRAMPGTIAGRTVDLGGQWIGAEQELFRGLAYELGTQLRPQHTDGGSIVEVGGKPRRIDGGIPSLPYLGLADFGIGMAQVGRMVKRLPDSGPWDAQDAAALDAQSLGSWIDSSSLTATARELGALVSRAIFCAEPGQVSLLYALECFRQGGGLRAMLEVEGGAQQDTVIGGVWSLLREVAREIDDAIRLSTPVEAIEHSDDRVRITTPAGEFTAKRAVIAVPPTLCREVAFTPSLPSRRRGLMQRMAMGSVLKAFIAYDRPFWREQGMSGAATSTSSALGLVFDHTENPDGPGVLVTLIEGEHAVEMGALTPEQRRREVVAELVRLFGQDAAHPIDYLDHDWDDDPWARGGYACYMPPGVTATFGRAVREPVGPLHWAGTETATRSIGYFEGAIQSGIRAAREVLADG